MGVPEIKWMVCNGKSYLKNPIKMGTPIVGNLHLHILDRGKSNNKPSPNYMDGLSLGLPQQILVGWT